MFSGIHSLIFGKKQKHKHDDSVDDKTQSDDFVVLERRHSGDFDQNVGLYPNLDPNATNLPYAISPSLPNLKEASADPESPKDETKVDMLQGVPFVLSSQISLLDEDVNKSFTLFRKTLEDLKESSDESLLENYNYDFELEHSVSSEFES